MSTTMTRAIEQDEHRVAPDWTRIRERYPAATHSTFLNITSGTPLSLAAKAAVIDLLEAQALGEADGDMRKPLMDNARSRFAQLIGASSTEIAVTKNVTEGLNIVAHAIDWRAGDNVVVCTDLEHPNNIYLWLALRDQGVEVRMPKARDGAIDTQAMIAAIDERTRIVTAASVTFAPGHRTELEAIGDACRAKGALFLVDGVQSCGILDLDVEACKIDALTTSASKGLIGIAGTGFLYVRGEWIERLRPIYIGRYSIERGAGHQSEVETHDYRLAGDARRFEAGNYNWSGIAAVQASLGELLAVGTPVIERRAVGLASALADELRMLEMPVTEPPVGIARSHIVTVGRIGAGDTKTTGDPKLDRVAAALKEGKVKYTIRKGLLRFGFHYYNNESDVSRVSEIFRSAVRG
jgi:selenocysteine lyase/cysteine desulfurase